MQPYYQSDFAPAEFNERRQRVFEALGPGAVAVIQGAPATGAFDLFRQTNDFYYLCGVEVPHACLLLDGRDRRTTLYLPPRDARHERSEGAQLNSSDEATAVRLTGVDRVREPAQLKLDLQGATDVFVPASPGETFQACRDTLAYAAKLRAADPWDERPSAEAHFRGKLVAVLPAAAFHDLSPVLDRLRVCKSPAELNLMRRAGELSGRAVYEAMRSTRPRMFEFELAALADYVYLKEGARGGGYRAIVASGKNIWNAHYFRNSDRLPEEEWVLMDYAPDVGYYTSDIGRMWPINGKYNAWQRELYGFIVEYHQALLALLRPGVLAAQVMQEAAARLRPVVEQRNWSRPEFAAAARKVLEFTGHCSHGVGMAVHDVGNYLNEPLASGVVFALDPQMWVPELELYVRVEDTVAITSQGVESLTAAAPLELAEVEALVGSGL